MTWYTFAKRKVWVLILFRCQLFEVHSTMDLGQIIYIVAIVGYFLYRTVTKKKAGENPDSENESANPPQKGLSFEDLLREIRDSQLPKLPEVTPQRQAKPVPIPVVIRSNEELKPAKKYWEREVDSEEEERYYEGAYEGKKKNPYQELANRNFADPESIKFKSYETQIFKPNPYAELLKNSKTVREAIVLSEILRPKHF